MSVFLFAGRIDFLIQRFIDFALQWKLKNKSTEMDDIGATTKMTQGQLQQITEENAAFLAIIVDCQRQGKVAEALEFQKRLQRNLLGLVDAMLQ